MGLTIAHFGTQGLTTPMQYPHSKSENSILPLKREGDIGDRVLTGDVTPRCNALVKPLVSTLTG